MGEERESPFRRSIESLHRSEVRFSGNEMNGPVARLAGDATLTSASAVNWTSRTPIATGDGDYLVPFAKPHVICQSIYDV